MISSSAVSQTPSWMRIVNDARPYTASLNLAAARTHSNERNERRLQCESSRAW